MGNNFSLTGKGGYDNDTRGNKVHIPTWLKNGEFGNVIERMKVAE